MGKIIRTLEWSNGLGVRGVVIAFSPDGKILLVSCENDQVAYLWDVAEGKKLEWLGIPSDQLSSATFSPDGKKILMIGAYGNTSHTRNSARIWHLDLETLKKTEHTFGRQG